MQLTADGVREIAGGAAKRHQTQVLLLSRIGLQELFAQRPREGQRVAGILEGRHDDHVDWALRQVQWLHANGRMFAERDHIHTKMYRYRGGAFRDPLLQRTRNTRRSRRLGICGYSFSVACAALPTILTSAPVTG